MIEENDAIISQIISGAAGPSASPVDVAAPWPAGGVVRGLTAQATRGHGCRGQSIWEWWAKWFQILRGGMGGRGCKRAGRADPEILDFFATFRGIQTEYFLIIPIVWAHISVSQSSFFPSK